VGPIIASPRNSSTLLVATGFVDTFGGIQTVERLVHRTLTELARSQGSRHITCSLRDNAAGIAAAAIPGEVVGAGGSRGTLVRLVIRYCFSIRPGTVVFTHVNVARMLPLVAVVRPIARRAVMAHGVEVWRSLDTVTGFAARFASEFWCVSEFTAQQLRRYNDVTAMPAYLLPNALEDTPSERQDAEAEPPTLLSVCRLESSERYKGLDLALRAHALLLKEMPDLRFHVVGEGTDLGRLRQLVLDLGTQANVTFLGRLSTTALAREYERCSLFVLPSRKEGFGIVFLEAMSRSKAVVALRCGGAPEVVIDEETGILVEPGNLLTLYDAIRRLLQNHALRARLGANGRRRVDAQFTPHAFAERLGALLAGRATPLPV
jgi:phosphatidylinositol alpha-1,6-mannosyltransferase